MRAAWIIIAVGCGGSPSEGPAPDAAATVGEDVALVGNVGLLGVDATHVYVSPERGTIARVAKAGGTLETMTTSQPSLGDVDVASDQLCWVNSGTHSQDFLDSSVHCMPKAGGAITQLSPAYFASALAVDGDAVFWTEIDGQRVRRIGMAGGTAETLDATGTHKRDLAITAGKLAWTASSDMADVVVMDRGTGDKRVVSTSEYSPGAIVLAEDDVFWVVQHSLSADGAIRVARGTGAPQDLAAGEQAPSQLVRIGTALYWTSEDRIRTVALAGGAATTIVEGRGMLGGIVADATHLYWAERDRGAIVRMPR